jgi:hypothetical protein
VIFFARLEAARALREAIAFAIACLFANTVLVELTPMPRASKSFCAIFPQSGALVGLDQRHLIDFISIPVRA